MWYFTYRGSGSTQQRGKSGRLYWFSGGSVTPVPIQADADWFRTMGTPEMGEYGYTFRETDVNGNPIGVFPPINEKLRVSNIDIRKFPSDQGLPEAAVWRLNTETYADPTLYFHHVRQWIRKS